MKNSIFVFSHMNLTTNHRCVTKHIHRPSIPGTLLKVMFYKVYTILLLSICRGCKKHQMLTQVTKKSWDSTHCCLPMVDGNGGKINFHFFHILASHSVVMCNTHTLHPTGALTQELPCNVGMDVTPLFKWKHFIYHIFDHLPQHINLGHLGNDNNWNEQNNK